MRFCWIIFFLLCAIVPSFCQDQTIGLFANEKEASRGYVLYSCNQYSSTYLLDNCGQIVNEWESEFTPGLSSYLDEDANLVRAGVLRESNKFVNAGTGGVLERFDWQGNLDWQVTINNDSIGLHHDFHIMDNGNILAIAWRRISMEDAIANGRDPSKIDEEVWSEVILEIKPVGENSFEVVWKWDVMDHLIQDFDDVKLNFGSVIDNPHLININNVPTLSPDWLHFNSIFYNDERDEIVISCREMNEIWIIDHSTSTDEASSGQGGNSGKGGDLLFRWGNDLTFDSLSNRIYLNGQHDAEFESDGSITLFNNGDEESGGSQILKIQPKYVDDEYVYQEGYLLVTEPEILLEGLEDNFTSDILSSVQLMDNENILVCKGVTSDFQEYNIDGELVWQYKGPVSLFGPNAQGTSTVGQTFKIVKYSVDDLRFDGLELDVLYSQLELDPLPFECDLYTATKESISKSIVVYMDNLSESLIVEGEGISLLKIFSVNGILLKSKTLQLDRGKIDMSNYPSGLYVVHLIGDGGRFSKLIFKY